MKGGRSQLAGRDTKEIGRRNNKMEVYPVLKNGSEVKNPPKPIPGASILCIC